MLSTDYVRQLEQQLEESNRREEELKRQKQELQRQLQAGCFYFSAS